MDRPTIVCLCGSTRFSEAFHEANLRETLGRPSKIVLSIGCDFKSDADLLLAGELTPADKERLDELHLRKIDLADEVLFLNVGGYMGHSTLRELFYATCQGKLVRFLESKQGDELARAFNVGKPWLEEQQQQGKYTGGISVINRRSWFRDDTIS